MIRVADPRLPSHIIGEILPPALYPGSVRADEAEVSSTHGVLALEGP